MTKEITIRCDWRMETMIRELLIQQYEKYEEENEDTEYLSSREEFRSEMIDEIYRVLKESFHCEMLANGFVIR